MHKSSANWKANVVVLKQIYCKDSNAFNAVIKDRCSACQEHKEIIYAQWNNTPKVSDYTLIIPTNPQIKTYANTVVSEEQRDTCHVFKKILGESLRTDKSGIFTTTKNNSLDKNVY